MEETQKQRLARIDAGVSSKSDRLAQLEVSDARVARQTGAAVLPVGRPVSRVDALAIARETLERAERERTEAAKREAGEVVSDKPVRARRIADTAVSDATDRPVSARVGSDGGLLHSKTTTLSDGETITVEGPSAMVRELPGLSGMAAKFLLALGECPSGEPVATMAKLMGVCERSVWRARAELSEKGLLPGS